MKFNTELTAEALLSLSLMMLVTATPMSGAAATLAPTPPMGWNNWAHYGCAVNETIIKANTDALVSKGLDKRGYNTVTVDDCWMKSQRDANGNLVVDPVTFPNGMKAIGDYLHAKGLKFGIYQDAGTWTCEGRAGSGALDASGNFYFNRDIAQFANWGVDFIKMDGCNVPTPTGMTSLQAYQAAYTAITNAIAATGRPMVFSNSMPAYFKIPYSNERGSPEWYTSLENAQDQSQMWREGDDVSMERVGASTGSRWGSVMLNYGYNRWLTRYAKPGNWNDPDFILGGDLYITPDEVRSQVALWSMMAAPLILSADLTKINDTALADISNPKIIAIDQDPLGKQANVLSTNSVMDLLAKPLANGDLAFAILNKTTSTQTFNTPLAALGFDTSGTCTFSVEGLNNPATAAWDSLAGNTIQVTRGGGVDSANVPSHGVAIYRVTPSSSACQASAAPGVMVGNKGKCVDVSGSNTADGTPILQFSCTGNANQKWTVKSDSTIQFASKCMTEGVAPNYPVTLQTCNNSASQKWTYKRNGNLASQATGKCLDVYNSTSTDGQPLQTFTCGNNQLNQIWTLPK